MKQSLWLPMGLLFYLIGLNPSSAQESSVAKPSTACGITAVLAPRQKAVLSAEVSTRVLRVAREFGQPFRQGDILVALDPTVYDSNRIKCEALSAVAKARLAAVEKLLQDQTQKRKAEANLAVAKAELVAAEEAYREQTRVKKAEALLLVAQKSLATTRKLFNDNAASDMDLEAAKKEVVVAQANLRLAQMAIEPDVARARRNAAVAQAELETTERFLQPDLEMARKDAAVAERDLRLALRNLESCKIRAPYDGRVARILVSEHELVQRGQPLVEIVDDRTLLAKFLLPSSALGRTMIGTKITIEILETGKAIMATISHVSAVIDPASESGEVYAEIDNRNSRLRSGMTGRVRWPPER